MIKFAKSMYGSFDSMKLGLKLEHGDVFAVTPEIAASQTYQDGVATKNFIPATVSNEYQLSQVKNLNDAIRAEFMATLSPVAPVPEVKKAVPIPKVEKTVARVPEPVPEVIPEEPALSFTEDAGNVKNALSAISKQTDIKKLEFALEHDERKSVKKAIKDRIAELK